MGMKNKILKTLTILVFLALITGFVAYRSGKISNPVGLSPNGGNITLTKENPKDSPAIKQRTMMSSSKSVIMTDLKFDSTKQYTKEDSQRIKRFQIMSSSKSLILTEPKLNFDSIKIQQLKQQK